MGRAIVSSSLCQLLQPLLMLQLLLLSSGLSLTHAPIRSLGSTLTLRTGALTATTLAAALICFHITLTLALTVFH